MIVHEHGKFIDETAFGTVERVAEYPNFVYHHPDGRTARHPIGLYATNGEDIFYTIEADGVHVHTPKRGSVQVFPWQ
jgi:hypothetical protein